MDRVSHRLPKAAYPDLRPNSPEAWPAGEQRTKQIKEIRRKESLQQIQRQQEQHEREQEKAQELERQRQHQLKLRLQRREWHEHCSEDKDLHRRVAQLPRSQPIQRLVTPRYLAA